MEQNNNIETEKIVCALSYLGILFFLPLVVYPHSSFSKFHANQGLIFLIASMVLTFAAGLLSIIFMEIGLFAVAYIISWSVRALLLAGLLYGAINALQGNQKDLPLIGKYRILK